MTRIAISVFVDGSLDAAGQVEDARRAGADLVELRADRATPESLAAVLRTKGSLATIVTVRPTWEGGRCDGDEAARLLLFEQAFLGGADFVDVELEAWERSAPLRAAFTAWLGAHPTRLILSNHDFDGRPADLLDRLARLRAVSAAHVLKLVWKAERLDDGVEALRLGLERPDRDPRPLVALAMGEEGQISRLLAAKIGAPFTFARVSGGAGSAPGQPTVDDLRRLYRWGEQRSETSVFGVAGWPVGHSMSPAIHNAGFASAGFSGVYVPLPIQPTAEAFSSAVDALRAAPGLRLRGLSVTLPHKRHALEYVRARGGQLDALSEHIGVINTIVVAEDGSLSGLNSDYLGAVEALASATGAPAAALAGARVAVIGAGGAASAIVAALAHHGATTTVYNRSLERAQELAARFDGTPGAVGAAPLAALGEADAQIYVNCTPIGMSPDVDGSPLPDGMALGPGNVVFDTIYNPLETRLLRTARAAGARTVGGIEMFVGQASAQFERFTGGPAPRDLFRRLVTSLLAPRDR